MSYTQMPNEALQNMNELSPGAWRLYCFLLYCRNRSTGKCMPSVPVCAEGIGVHPKFIFALRNELSKKKWAKFTGNSATLRFMTDSQENLTSNTDTTSATADTKRNSKENLTSQQNLTNLTDIESTKPDSGVNKTLLDGKENLTPLLYVNQKKEPKETNQSEKPSGASRDNTPQIVAEIFTYWQVTTGQPRMRLTDQRKDKIQARLKNYSVAEIKQAIDGAASSPWHRGENPQRARYDDLVDICRNDTRLEKFMALAVQTRPAAKVGYGVFEGMG